MNLISNTSISSNKKFAKMASDMLSFNGASLAKTDEEKTLADNPYSDFYEYKDDYESIVKKGVSGIYSTTQPSININQMQYTQPAVNQVPIQFIQQPYQQVQYITKEVEDNTKVDISKYIGKKKKEEPVAVSADQVQLQTIKKATEPILAKLEGLMEIMGLVFQEIQRTNELLSGEVVQNYSEDKESFVSDDQDDGDVISKIESSNMSPEEELRALEELASSMTPPPTPEMEEQN